MKSRIEGIQGGEYRREDAIEKLKGLQEITVLSIDSKLDSMIKDLKKDSKDFIEGILDIFYYISDTYRINRRILKNRRQRLIKEGQIAKIERKCNYIPYKPTQLEIDATDAIKELLVEARRRKAPEVAIMAVGKILYQCLSDPQHVMTLIKNIVSAEAKPSLKDDIVYDSAGIASHEERVWVWGVLCATFNKYVSAQSLNKAAVKLSNLSEGRDSDKRLTVLLKYLKSSKTKYPRSKIIIFVGFPAMAENLCGKVGEEFGSKNVTLFHADLESKEKEENVSNFQSDHGPWIMVSDETGGEGRNFQFATGLVHYDNPWDVGKVEQRIGRLDRLGREKFGLADVISTVIYNEWSDEAGLVKCYGDGLKVYTESISGLEFALREIGHSLFIKGLEEGNAGLEAYVAPLQELAVKERVRDEGEELYDEASFDRRRSEEFKRISVSKDVEEGLLAAFLEYFQFIAPGRSMIVSEKRGRITFLTDSITKVKLNENYVLHHENKEWGGTFLRCLAQVRPDLQFFTFGNVFFDAIIDSLASDPNGKTFAIERITPGAGTWYGFKAVYRLMPDLELLNYESALIHKAEMVLNDIPTSIFVTVNGKVEKREKVLTALKEQIDFKSKNITWWNLTKDKTTAIAEHFGGQKWKKIVLGACEKAELEAKKIIGEIIGEKVRLEENRILEMIRQAKKQVELHEEKHKDEKGAKEMVGLVKDRSKDDIKEMSLLLKGIKNWKVHLDSVGFISINGTLIGK